MLILENARIFDGHAMLIGQHNVAIEGAYITEVSTDPITGEGRRIDLHGMTLMPGLITSHMHPDYFKYTLDNFIAGEQPGKERPPGVMMAIGIRTCRVLLESGFTGYIGAACTNDVDAQLKIAISEDLVPGPRILACGHHIGTTADNNDPRKWWQKFQTPGLDLFADGPIALRALVRDEIRRGVEVIKIFASSGHAVPGDRGRRNMARDEIAAIVEAAHDRGAKVRAHVCHKALILEAIELGVDIIDHGDEVDEECVAAMVAANSFWVPSLKFLQIGIDQGWADPGGSIAYAYNNIKRILPMAQAAGVRILIGDDYGGDPLRHEVGIYGTELELYANIDGLTTVDVLGWATYNAGQLLAGDSEILGVVRSGALADLIVVNGIPTDNISLFASPEGYLKALIRDGKLVIDRLHQI